MLPSNRHEQSAIAFQLLAASQEYDAVMERLVGVGFDIELYMSGTRLFDTMRMYSASLPKIQVAWIQVLISRFELYECLWTMRGSHPDNRVRALHARHRNAVAELSGLCIAHYTARIRVEDTT